METPEASMHVAHIGSSQEYAPSGDIKSHTSQANYLASTSPVQTNMAPPQNPAASPRDTTVLQNRTVAMPHTAATAPVKEAFDSTLFQDDNKFHLLLCASGSVATIKIPVIAKALSLQPQISIRIILTPSAAEFLQGQSEEQPSVDAIAEFPNVEGIYQDADEWAIPWTRGAKILHIELRRWADLMVVAPLSANTMAKMVAGLCDGLLLSTMRAWDVTGQLSPARVVRLADRSGQSWSQAKRSIIVAPAMNTAMWHHPLTGSHMQTLEGPFNVENGGFVEVMRPVEKTLACGDTGSGAMTDWKGIVRKIERYFNLAESNDQAINEATSASQISTLA